MIEVASLNTILEVYDDVYLISKTASGKTSLIFSYFSEMPKSIIFLSPLKSINLEVEHRAIKTFGEQYICAPKNINDHKKLLDRIKNNVKTFIVLSLEKIPEGFFEAVYEYDRDVLIVIDEVHLFWHWGDCFRPIIWEKYCEVKNTKLSLLMLTATLNDEFKNNIIEEQAISDRRKIVIQTGNYALKKNPQKIHYFSNNQKKQMYRKFIRALSEKKPDETILVFLPYRQQVSEWRQRLVAKNVSILTCMSGEVETFKNSLIDLQNKNINPDLILSTITLSHGVNLPCISKIFIFYQVQHRDFWVQMVGRGGRQGENFSVYEMNGFDYHGLPKKKLFLNGQYFKNVIQDYVFKYI